MANINNLNYSVIIQQAPDPSSTSTTGAIVVASLPDSFTFDTAAEYAAPFAQGLFGNGMAANIAKLAGIKLTVQALTAQIWQGSTETSLGLDLEFHAETDADLDVRQPILTLLKMATASADSLTGFLKSPGPNIDLSSINSVGSTVGGQAVAQLTGGTTVTGIAVRPGRLNAQGQALNGQNASAGTPAVKNGLGSAEYWKSQISNQISIQIGSYAFFDSIVITNVQKTYGHTLDDNGLPMYAKVQIQFKPLFLLVQADLDNIFSSISSTTNGTTSTPTSGAVPAGSAYYKS